MQPARTAPQCGCETFFLGAHNKKRFGVSLPSELFFWGPRTTHRDPSRTLAQTQTRISGQMGPKRLKNGSKRVQIGRGNLLLCQYLFFVRPPKRFFRCVQSCAWPVAHCVAGAMPIGTADAEP